LFLLAVKAAQKLGWSLWLPNYDYGI